ncbi:DDB1- and CUL4-associated factor 17-like [Palaemon carinicauda]|uniref:DDB1- and CUL4-associated factor 17-like n=1 Tax=Palaemon carinicauda TaxID=392227 RepID=UPI0035B6192A
MWALRHVTFGPRRRWKQVFRGRETSILEFSGDLMWITDPFRIKVRQESVMQRICSDGRVLKVFHTDLAPRPKEVLLYTISDPIYRSDYPQKEYRPTILALRKGNILTRQDMLTGETYDSIYLGDMKASSMSSNFMQDLLVVKSAKLTFDTGNEREYFFQFKVFQMHPFCLISSFKIDGSVFPAHPHKHSYGKLRSVEVHDGMLLVMTKREFTLVYDAQSIIESKRVNGSQNNIDFLINPERPDELVTKAPPLLFATHAHMDILGMGACPWTYIRAVCDNHLEVRDLQTGSPLIDGQVIWRSNCDQELSPDYLMFFPDDSNRLVHVKTNRLRVLEIRDNEDPRKLEGPRRLVEVFTYPATEPESETAPEAVYSRSGRVVKNKLTFDLSLNRSVTFDVETDLMVMVIVEARRDTSKNSSYIAKATFYDSVTYEFLHELIINEGIYGDIETSRLNVHFERDVLNIVTYEGSNSKIFSYRLHEIFDECEEYVNKGPRLIPYCNIRRYAIIQRGRNVRAQLEGRNLRSQPLWHGRSRGDLAQVNRQLRRRRPREDPSQGSQQLRRRRPRTQFTSTRNDSAEADSSSEWSP